MDALEKSLDQATLTKQSLRRLKKETKKEYSVWIFRKK
jgi:hypothetical protein